MLSIFSTQFLALFAYTILRVVVGVVLIYLGLSHVRRRAELAPRFSFSFFPFGTFFAWYLAVVELVAGTLFILGLYTQIGALLSFLLSLKFIMMHKKFGGTHVPGRLFYVLLLGASLSLFITGAGFFAFDLPI